MDCSRVQADPLSRPHVDNVHHLKNAEYALISDDLYSGPKPIKFMPLWLNRTFDVFNNNFNPPVLTEHFIGHGLIIIHILWILLVVILCVIFSMLFYKVIKVFVLFMTYIPSVPTPHYNTRA